MLLRIFLFLLLIGCYSGGAAFAACPAAPVANVKDAVIQMKKGAGNIGLGPTDVVDATEEGAVVYDSANDRLMLCDGTNWVPLAGSGSGGGGAASFAFNARGTATLTSQVLNSFSDIVANVGSAYDNTTGRFTATEAGTYYFSAAVLNTNGTSGNVYIYKNGTDIIGNAYSNTAAYNSATTAGVVALDVGDYVTANMTAGTAASGAWHNFSGFKLGGGSDTLAGLSCQDGEVAAWNAGNSAWECSASAGGGGSGGSTMVSGWPDAIVCKEDGTAWMAIMYYNHKSATPQHVYRMAWSTGDFSQRFSDAGAYVSQSGDMNTPNNCTGKSISQLYADGQAFNFVGGNGGGGGETFAFLVNEGSSTATTSIPVSNFTEVHDVSNAWSSNRFQPTEAGDYYIAAGGTAYLCDNTARGHLAITKNGTVLTRTFARSRAASGSGDDSMTVGAVVNMNGTTDYIDIHAYISSGTCNSITEISASGFKIGGGSGSGGGSADNLGDHTATEALDMATYDITNAGDVYATTYFHTSDARLKDDIALLDDPFAILNGLRGVSYVWKSNGKPATGVIAQEVEAVLPAAVATNADGMKSVEYDQLIAPMIEAIKALKVQNDALRAELKALQARLPE